MIKAVIFDLDGVVIDSEPIWLESWKKFLEKRGINDSLENDAKTMGLSQKDTMLLYKKHYKLKDKVDDLIKERLGILLEFYEEGIPLTEGVLPLIKRICKNKLRTALASSSPLRVIQFVIKKLSLENYFDVVVSSDFVSKGKPAPDIFLYTAKKLETKPNECLVIEDSPNGILAAKNAGMKCIAFRYEFNKNMDLSEADLIVDDLNELTLDKILSLWK